MDAQNPAYVAAMAFLVACGVVVFVGALKAFDWFTKRMP